MLKFVDNKIKKLKFHSSKYPISRNNADVKKITRSNKFACSTGFQSLIGYKNDEVVPPLCIMLPKMSGFVRVLDKSKNMTFLIKNKLWLKKYNKIWDKVSNTMKKQLIVNQRT